MNMKQKKTYTAPAVLEELYLEAGVRILAQSVFQKDTEIESVGQEIEYHEVQIGDDGFSHGWE